MAENLTGYDAKYANGNGWQYSTARETVVVRDFILRRLGVPVGSRVLEVGCGEGFHANLMRIQGMIVDAVDISKPGILNARANYPYRTLTFRCDDARNLHSIYRDEAFTLVFSRAMSWFHRDLTQSVHDDGLDLRAEMTRLMALVKTGGHFCLQVCTDFSGETRNGVCMNTAEAYISFFEMFGEIVRFSDWRGNILDRVDPTTPFGGIIIAVKKA